MSRTTDRQYFAIALGWIALAAAAVVLIQFAASFGLAAFWTFKWTISVVLILGLFGAGVGFLNVGGSRSATRLSMTAFGLAFMLAAIALFGGWAYYHSAGQLSFKQYLGFLFLFGALVGVAVACIAAISKDYLRFASYGFGVVDVLYLFRLIQKYIFGTGPVQWPTFLGEVVVLALGVLLFLALFFGSEESRVTTTAP